jgi:hypothetical protein
MLIWLAKSVRFCAAGVLAVIYTLCVLAPAAAFAFGDGSRAAHCLTDNNHGLTKVHVHKDDVAKSHIHKDGTAHQHSKAPDGNGKPSDSQCCGLGCLSALPADKGQVYAPSLQPAIMVPVQQEDVAGNSPDRLYRPPIS